MNEMEETKSTGTYDSEKTKQIANSIADISDDQIKLIGDNIGHISKSIDLIANFCKIGENTKQFFAKEIGKEYTDTPATVAIAQAFYSMIVHTPAIYGRKTIKGKDCIIYQKINIEDAGNDKLRGVLNWFDKHMKTYVNMHALLYGLVDRYPNTLILKDKHGNNQLCGIDIDSNGYGFLAFSPKCLPTYKQQDTQFFGYDFLNAKRSRLRIVEDECKKLANFDYNKFLHRCVINFKILGIEKEQETWETFNNFLRAARNYKEKLSEYFDNDRVKRKSEKCCITKLKDKILGYGDKYEAPELVQQAIKTDYNNFFNFIKEYLEKYKIEEDDSIDEENIKKIIEDYGDNYRKNHSKSNVNNCQSKINVNNCQSKINFDNFHASTHGLD